MSDLLKNIGFKEIVGAIVFLGGLYGNSLKTEYNNKIERENERHETSVSIGNIKYEFDKQFILVQGEISGVKVEFTYFKNEMNEKLKNYD